MAWRRERVGRISTVVEAGAEKERVHDVDPAMVEKTVSEALTWTRR
jgi:hypothetical protein